MTTTVEQAIQKIEAAVKTLEHEFAGFLKDTVEPAIEAEWTALKPQVLGLGQTVLGQVWTAAETYLVSGGPLNPGAAANAVGAVVAQLPADLQALEHLVMAAFAGAVQSISGKQATPAAP
jgi:hypothetical protein